MTLRAASASRLSSHGPRLSRSPFPDEQALFKTLSGVSSEVLARAGKGEFREAALFTHRGLSGPAILQVSSYWRHGEHSSDQLPA